MCEGSQGSQQSMCGVLSYSELLTNLTTTPSLPHHHHHQAAAI